MHAAPAWLDLLALELWPDEDAAEAGQAAVVSRLNTLAEFLARTPILRLK